MTYLTTIPSITDCGAQTRIFLHFSCLSLLYIYTQIGSYTSSCPGWDTGDPILIMAQGLYNTPPHAPTLSLSLSRGNQQPGDPSFLPPPAWALPPPCITITIPPPPPRRRMSALGLTPHMLKDRPSLSTGAEARPRLRLRLRPRPRPLPGAGLTRGRPRSCCRPDRHKRRNPPSLLLLLLPPPPPQPPPSAS